MIDKIKWKIDDKNMIHGFGFSLLLAAQLLDYQTTAYTIETGLGYETNTLMSSITATPALFLAVKIAEAVLLASIVMVYDHTKKTDRTGEFNTDKPLRVCALMYMIAGAIAFAPGSYNLIVLNSIGGI